MRKHKFPEWQLLTTSIIIYHIPVEFSNLIVCVYNANRHRLPHKRKIYLHLFDERLNKSIRHSITDMDRIVPMGLTLFENYLKK